MDLKAKRTRLPTDLIDDLVVREISIDAWRALLHALGEDAPLPADEAVDHATILNALSEHEMSERMLDALSAIVVLGSQAGLEALLEAADHADIDRSHWPLARNVRDIAVLLWIESESNVALANVLLNAQVTVLGLHRRRTVFVLRGPPGIAGDDPLAAISDLRDGLSSSCIEQGRGSFVTIQPFRREGEVIFRVTYGKRLRRMNFIVEAPATTALETRQERLAAFDLIRYEPDENVLRISTSNRTMVSTYRRLFGQLLFQNPDFFEEARIVNLKPLQSGRESLENPMVLDATGVIRASLEMIRWDRSADERMTLQAKDCFETIERDELAIEEGRIVEAKLALVLPGPSRRRVRVHLTAPNKVDYLRDKHEAYVEPFLERTGLCRLREDDGDERLDLWSLYTWEHTRQRWRQALFDRVDDWIEKGLLQPVSDAEPKAVPKYRLDLSRLALEIAKHLELKGEVQVLRDESIAVLGAHPQFGSKPTCFLLVARQPRLDPSAFDAWARELAGPARVVLLVPRERSLRTKYEQVDLDWSDFTMLRPCVVHALQEEAVVPPLWCAPPSVRLVIASSKGAWLDRTKIKLKPSNHAFAMLEMLAKQAGELVPYTDINQIAPGRCDARQSDAARRWKKEIVSAIEQSFEDAGLPPPGDYKELIKSERGTGYRLTVQAHCQ